MPGASQPSTHHFQRAISKAGTQVVDCLDCGFWHVLPLPSAAELRQYYVSTYFETLGDNRSMTDKLRDPDGFYTLQYEDKLRRLERLLPSGAPRTVLDVGCGYGDFVRFMQERGWRARGVEASPAAVAVAREWGLDVRVGGVEDLASMDLEPATVVVLNSVLEHLADPWSTLGVLRTCLLAPGGIVNIHVPNDFNPLQLVLADTVLRDSPKTHYWVAIPDHVNYWTPETMRRFLTHVGYRVLLVASTFPLELFPLMGEDYISVPEVGRTIHLKRVRFEQWLREAGAVALKDALYEHLATLGLGREMEVFAVPERAG